MQAETRFKERVLRDLRSYGPRLFFIKTQMTSVRGVPDILICAGSVFIAIELKVPRTSWEGKYGALSELELLADPLQRHTLRRIHDAGGVAVVAIPESWDQTKKEIIEPLLLAAFDDRLVNLETAIDKAN